MFKNLWLNSASPNAIRGPHPCLRVVMGAGAGNGDVILLAAPDFEFEQD